MSVEQSTGALKRPFLPKVIVFRFFRRLFAWRMMRRYLFVLVCLVTFVALFYAVENWRGKRAWENYKREWEAKGEVFDWKSFVPPMVPEEQNFASAPLFYDILLYWQQRTNPSMAYDTNKIKLLKVDIFRKDEGRPTEKPKIGDWLRGRRTDLKGFQEYYRNSVASTSADGKDVSPQFTIDGFPIARESQSPADDVMLALTKYSYAHKELDSASKRPNSRFALNYEANIAVLLPHLPKLLALSQYLELLSAAELEAGAAQRAAENIDLHFYLADSIKTEPVIISQLTRVNMFKRVLNSIWEGMADHRWSEEQLHHFQDRMQSMDFLSDIRLAIRTERAMNLQILQSLGSARMHSPLPEMFGDFSDEVSEEHQREHYLMALYGSLAPRGWFDQNKVVCARFQQEELLEAIQPEAQLVDLEILKSAERDPRITRKTPYNFLARLFLEASPKPPQRAAYSQTSVNLAVVACALERYYLTNKSYPENLEQLMPRFIGKLPHEISSGDPLKYLRSEDGRFVLYSIGADGKDDGGAYPVTKDGKETGDWVWRYPTKDSAN